MRKNRASPSFTREPSGPMSLLLQGEPGGNIGVWVVPGRLILPPPAKKKKTCCRKRVWGIVFPPFIYFGNARLTSLWFCIQYQGCLKIVADVAFI